MLKHLLVFILFLFFFTAVYAQTDSVVTHAPVDTLIKHPSADSLIKQPAIDSTAKRPVIDSAIKHAPIDSAIKHTAADSVIKKLPVDSLIKHPADSIAPKPVIDVVIKKPTADSIAKRPVIDSVATHPIAENVIKHSTKNAPPKQPVVVPPVIIIHSPIKTLTDKQYNAYLKGEDMDDMALVGEMNHYPLPDQALKFKVQLGLNPGQITKLKDLVASLHRKKVQMGDNIIRNEKMLDSLFHSKQIVDGTLIFYTNRSGLYLGELRGAILMTCYDTEQILSDDQIKKLTALQKVN